LLIARGEGKVAALELNTESNVKVAKPLTFNEEISKVS